VKSSRELTPLSRTAELDELLELARMLRARIVECLRPPDASSAPRRERIAAYVLTHCQGPLRLDDLARHLALSSSRTSQLVRELFNETMPELVTRFRLEQAKSMLDHSDYSIAEVADKSGFSEVGYLHRVFQRHFGLTPGEYRKRERRDRARSV
jgi:AraC-like DNA-binding protein